MNSSERPRNTIARKPSHLGSNSHPRASGSSTASLASIGATPGSMGNSGFVAMGSRVHVARGGGFTKLDGMERTGRRVRYQVAASLDGYIAGPNGEYDWITMDPDIDFVALAAQFDTYLMGRTTYEMMRRDGHMVDGEIFVFSRTLGQADHPGVTIVSEDSEKMVRELKARPGGKDIWLYGGGQLFRSLLEIGLVDRVEVAVIPVLLGAGIPLLPGPALRRPLRLESHRLYPGSGIVLLEYGVDA